MKGETEALSDRRGAHADIRSACGDEGSDGLMGELLGLRPPDRATFETGLGTETFEPDPRAGAALTVHEAQAEAGDVMDVGHPVRVAGREHQALLPPEQRRDAQVRIAEQGIERVGRRALGTVMETRRIRAPGTQMRQGIEAAGDGELDVRPRFDDAEQKGIVTRRKPERGGP